MDIYLEEDKNKVVSKFSEIRKYLMAVCDDSADKAAVTDAISNAIRDIQLLSFDLKHMDGYSSSDVSDSNKPGLDVLKANIRRLCEDIDQSIQDTSWIEGADTFAENQRTAVNEMVKAITEKHLTGIAKANAEQDLELLKSFTPPDGAADWVVREMRNQMILAGIKSHLNSTLITLAEM